MYMSIFAGVFKLGIGCGRKKSTEEIDGAVATSMVLERGIQCGNDISASVYNGQCIFCRKTKVFALNSINFYKRPQLERLFP